jgi:hypothetical protein
MASLHLPAADALARVRAARGIIRPNPAFARQLEAYGASLGLPASSVEVGPPRPAKTGLAGMILRAVRRRPNKGAKSGLSPPGAPVNDNAMQSTSTLPVSTGQVVLIKRTPTKETVEVVSPEDAPHLTEG